MPKVKDIEERLFALAPKDLACDWDNVGLLVGDGSQEVTKVLVALDVTAAVVREAVELGAQLIVSHHPVMNVTWHRQELQTLRVDTRLGRLLRALVKADLSVISMHTNLDAAQGGVNDALAGALGLSDVELLGDPEGIGRMGLLPSALALPDFLDLTRGALRPNGIRYCDGGKPVHRVAVGGGACGDFFRLAIEKGCDALVTADVKYDQFLDASALGLSLIDAGHFPTEDLICPVLAEHLKKQFPDLTVTHSAVHREVVQYYL